MLLRYYPMSWWDSIEKERIQEHLDAISCIGLNPETKGYTRPSYSSEETDIMNHFRTSARFMGLHNEFDELGNLMITCKGKSDRKIIIGSHCDSVLNGGNYDGNAGVSIAMSIIEAMKENEIKPDLSVSLMAIRAEESQWFGTTYIGSKAALGILPPETLKKKRKDDKRTLEYHIGMKGYNPELIRKKRPSLEVDNIEMYIEAHIEQTSLLRDEYDSEIGIVTAIRGNRRHKRINFVGQYGHSGAVPDNLRKDAVSAMCALVSGADDIKRKYVLDGKDIVLTFGMMHTNSERDGITTIPGEAWMSLDIRSTEDKTLADFYSDFSEYAKFISREKRVAIMHDEMIESSPALMDRNIVSGLSRSAESLGIKSVEMPSGAGHDASVFANYGIPSGMVFLKHNGLSHCPGEDIDYDSAVAAAQTIAKFIDSYSG